jgi:tetratricopeptide (TPR) repeat protein
MLVLLDNASGAEQVRPLLPGSSAARVAVTSRDALSGLVAVDGARRLELGPLPSPDARTLLGALIGSPAAAEPDAVDALAGRCARLPLALRIAAELVRSRPGAGVAALVAELDRHRLDLLDAGDDPRAAVRAVFSWSYRRLPPAAARMFRLVGLHPAPDLDVHAAAALAGGGVREARTLLDQLSRAHLLEPGHGASPGGERYAAHDLLRAYAAELGAGTDDVDQRQAAQQRLWTYYVAAAAAATDRLFPAEVRRRSPVPPAVTPVPDFPTPESARMWLDRERLTLAIVTAYTAEHCWPDQAVRLGSVLVRYLTNGHFTDALEIYGHSLRAARLIADPNGEALAVLGIGGAYWRMGQYAPAEDHLHRALKLYEQTGDALGQARALDNLGTVKGRLGDPTGAVDCKERALLLFRQLGDRVGEARVLGGLGDLLLLLGRHQAGADAFGQALELFRRTGDRLGEGAALDGLGLAAQSLGHHGEALQHHLDALAQFRALGYRNGEAHVLDNIGDAHAGLGQPEEAGAHHCEALALHRETGDRHGQMAALNGIGEAACAAGAHADALARHTEALTLSNTTADRRDQAQAHAGLGRAHDGLGDVESARRHLGRALALYTELGYPAAEDVRTELQRIGLEN